MDKILTIGITTFRNRLETVTHQIDSIRSISENITILLAINSNYKEELDEEYRKNILNVCVRYNGVYPLFFPKFTGLAKMWNNLIVHAATPFVYIMNDDLVITNSKLFDSIIDYIKKIETLDQELFEAPSGYSHYVISKNIAHELGYFDERFIGFAEEDGDLYWRYVSRFLKKPVKLPVAGIHNMEMNREPGKFDSNFDFSAAKEDPLYQFMPPERHTPRFNTEFRMMKYKPNESGVQGMFQFKMAKCVKDEKQYPYEKFIQDNQDNLGNYTSIKI